MNNQSCGGLRRLFFSERSFFDSNLFNCDEDVGFVLILFFAGVSVFSSMSKNCWVTFWRLRSWLRSLSDTKKSSPSMLILFLSFCLIMLFCASENTSELFTEKRSSTRVFTLFTFCPPGPLLRLAEKVHSVSSCFFCSEERCMIQPFRLRFSSLPMSLIRIFFPSSWIIFSFSNSFKNFMALSVEMEAKSARSCRVR